MKECPVEQNKKECPCTWEPCDKKGICCECLRFHWVEGELPVCLFPPEWEKGRELSVESLIESYRKRGKWWNDPSPEYLNS